MARVFSASSTLQTLGAFAHTNFSSPQKFLDSTCSNLLVIDLRTRPRTAFRGLNTSWRHAPFNDLHRNWSCSSIEAHQSYSITKLGDRSSAPRNTPGTENAQGVASSNDEDEDLELEKGYKMINVCLTSSQSSLCNFKSCCGATPLNGHRGRAPQNLSQSLRKWSSSSFSIQGTHGSVLL